MSETKDILILASSFKDGGRCVAGKTVDDKQWIRPVSESGGSLSDAFFQGAQVRQDGIVGGVYGVPLSEHCPDRHQRENWIAESGVPWQFRRQVSYDDLALYADEAETLWANNGGRNNVVSVAEAEEQVFSLLLIKVQDASLEFAKGAYKLVRARFPYGNYEYFLNARTPEIGAMVRARKIPRHLPECFMCVSLCHNEWEDGMCHKVVASVITPEHFQ